MSKSDRNYIMYLEDMHEAMSRIEEYLEGYSFISFKKDYKTVDAVIRNFEPKLSDLNPEASGPI